MANIFGPSKSGPSTTATATKANSEIKDVADAASGDLKIQRMTKGAGIGVLFQIICTPVLLLLLRYQADSESSKFNSKIQTEFNMYWLVKDTLIELVRRLFSVCFSLGILWILLITFLETMILGLSVKVWRILPESQLQWMYSCFRTRMWIGCLATAIFTCLLTRIYTSVLNLEYANLTYVGLDDNGISVNFVNEKHWFLLFCSFSIGVYSFWIFIVEDAFTVKFATIQRSPLDIIRNSLINNLSESVTTTSTFLPVFYVLYYVQGGIIRQLMSFCGWHFQAVELGRMIQFFDLELWIYTAMWSTISVFFLRANYSFLIFAFTERLQFPMESEFFNNNIVRLGDAMNTDETYMKFLGFYEFMILTRAHSKQILKFFELSHPGGHPRNWTRACEATLNLCEQMSKFILVRCKPPRTFSSPPIATGPENAEFLRKRISLYSVGTTVSEPESANNPSSRNRAYYANMRDLTYPPTAQTAPSQPSLGRIFLMSPFILWQGITGAVTSRLKSQLCRVVNLKSMGDKPEPELEIANCLNGCQLLTWGINAIVEIACVSIDYDKHGVVQRDMKSIIMTLVDLYEALVVYVRNPPPQCKIGSSRTWRKESVHKANLLIQCCIFALSKIHGRFEFYYEILGVSKEYQKKTSAITQLQNSPRLLPYRLVTE